MFKKLICKWFGLVPVEELRKAQLEIEARYDFLQRMAKTNREGPIRIVAEYEQIQNEDIDLPVFVVGNHVRIINLRSKYIEICHGTKFTYLSGVSFPTSPKWTANNNIFMDDQP